VLVSTDGGATYPYSLLRAGENGTGSFATNSVLATTFTPTSGADWCFTDNTPGCFTVDLSPFDGEANVRVKFVAYNSGGNNIYVDNVKVTGICSVTALNSVFSADDQTICPGTTVQYTDQSQGAPTSWSWSFPGGTPNASTLQNPTVTYNTAGTYDAQLIVTNAGGSDTTLIFDYITVNPAPAAPVITINGGMLQSSYISGNQWYLNGGQLPGATNNTYTPTDGGTYTVTYTDANGCSATSAPFIFSTGIADEKPVSFSIYPNPAQETIQVKTNGFSSSWTVRITDITGKQVLQQVSVTAQTSIDIRSLVSGIYLVTVQDGAYSRTVRIVKM
jgi:hypothetical protein